MQYRPARPDISTQGENNSSVNVTAAVGMEETVGQQRARRSAFYTRTIMWVTGLLCTAFLLGTIAQAWSNSQLMQQVQAEQQRLQQVRQHNAQLQAMGKYYKDSTVIENEARQQLGYIRPGEHAIVIVSPQQEQSGKTRLPQSVPAQQGFWQQWWETFFGA